MEFLLLKYGYLLLFLGVFLEGEAFLLAGAFLANRGYFSLTLVVLIALAANTLGAQFYFLAARMRGQPWFESRFSGSGQYRRILDGMRSYGSWVLLLSRFAFGFRIIIPAACGALGMSQLRFFILNLAAGVLWAIPTAFIGYYFGTSFSTTMHEAHRYVMQGLVAGFLLLAIYLAIRHWRTVIATFQHLEFSDLHGLLPFVMGLMGVLNLVSAFVPGSETALNSIQRWLPLEVTQESRTLMLFAGVALLQVTRSLARRKETAWYVAVIGLSISLVLHAAGGFDLQHSLIALLLLAYLIYFRRRFYARSDSASMKRALVAAPLLTLLVFAYGVIGFEATAAQFRWLRGAHPMSEAFRAGVLILEPTVVPLSRHAGRFLTSLQVAGWISRVYILVLLLRPVVLRDRQEAPRGAVRRIFSAYGNYATCAFAVQTDKHHLLLAHGRGLAAYATRGAVAITCGDPMSPSEDFPNVVTEFTDHCVRHGWTPSFYLACEERLAAYHSLGFASQRTAEEGLLDLRGWDDVAFRSLAIPGVTVTHYDRARGIDPFLDEQLEEVTEDWLQTRQIGEPGFTLGHFSLESLSDGPVMVLRKRHRVEAFCAWLPYRNKRAMVMDLMRQRHTAPANSGEWLVAESLRLLASMGVEEASLSTIPLGQTTQDVMNPVDRDLIAVFAPRWENRYIVYPRGAALARINYALAAVQFGRFRMRWRHTEA
jgi:phosphatidylglycerol lysyltransferase